MSSAPIAPVAMNRLVALAGLAVLVLTGCRSAETISPGAVAIPTPDVLPAGTELGLRLEQRLGLGISDAGDPFRATVASLVVTGDGALVVPAGAEVFGTVAALDAPVGGQPAVIRLAFDRLVLEGETYPLSATVVRTDVDAEEGEAARGRVLSDAPGPGTAISLGTAAEAARLDLGTLLVVTLDQQILLR